MFAASFELLFLLNLAPAAAPLHTFPAVLDLSSLDGKDGFRLDGVARGEHKDEHYGAVVAGNCDINGDGISDLIIGLKSTFLVGFTSGPPNDIASSYVVFGKSRDHFPARIDLAQLNGGDGFRIEGLAGHVACAGDVNGDHVDDLIIGVSQAAPTGILDAGSTFVVFGRRGTIGDRIRASDLDGTNGFRLDGESAGEQSGFAVASAGDMNGDGFADLMIGAPGADPNEVDDAGSTYVVFGRSRAFPARIRLGHLNGTNGFRIDGTVTGWSGWSVASAGDINGDGLEDLTVGAPQANYYDGAGRHITCCDGSAYVIFGTSSRFPAHISLADLDGTNGFRLVGVKYGSATGGSVATAGDVNGDRLADLIVGAGSDLGIETGRSYVVLGSTSGFPARIELPSLAPPTGFRVQGVAPGDHSGASVASADVNGDGLSDLIIGAPGADPTHARQDAGSVYAVFGKTARFPSPFALSTLNGENGFKLIGENAQDNVGVSVTSAGDVNGDRVPDLFMGALSVDDQGRYHGGPAYVVFGKPRTLSEKLVE